MKQFYLSALLLSTVLLFGYNHSVKVDNILQKAGKNRFQLEMVLNHYHYDSIRYKASCFLIENMGQHYSMNYYWADTLNTKIFYNELDYPDFEASVKAFDSLKQQYKGVHPVSVQYMDYDTISAAYLIKNIDMAVSAWQKGIYKSMSFRNFCEYLLPYRISVEPLQDWRSVYNERFRYINDLYKSDSQDNFGWNMSKDLRSWFEDTYRKEVRKEPLPRLGALQLLHRAKGACEDMANLEVFILRSQGIPSTFDFVPFWATSTGSHWLNVWFDTQEKAQHFDGTSQYKFVQLVREPGKVMRTTFSEQSGNLSLLFPAEEIPNGYMRTANYTDVTDEYWEVSDISCKLFSSPFSKRISYICVLNGLQWKPIYWGAIHNDSVMFRNMSRGAVYMPMYYHEKKLIPAGYPILSDYQRVSELQPDTLRSRTIVLAQQEKYLMFRPGKKYTLLFWNKRWQKIGTQIAGDHTTELWFENVPYNALLLLVPEYSQRKERPFTIDENGVRSWW